MKIKELSDILYRACMHGAGDCELEFWIELNDGDSIMAELKSVGQFSVIPDMTITVCPTNNNGKIYTRDIPNTEQFNYKDKYEKLLEAVNDLNNNVYQIKSQGV